MAALLSRPIRAALSALVLAAAASGAQAAPDNSDLLAKLLIDKGMVDAHAFDASGKAGSAAQFGRQMRDATSDMVVSAMNFLGVPYKRGGTDSGSGFDCSGFTRHLYENSLGLLLPRKVDDQAKASGLAPVRRDDLKPGDLVFFNTLRRTFSHVGIYVGDDKFIHSPKPGGEVRVESLGVAYWAKRFTGARRAAQAPAVSSAAVMPAATAVTTSVAPVAEPARAIPNDLSP